MVVVVKHIQRVGCVLQYLRENITAGTNSFYFRRFCAPAGMLRCLTNAPSAPLLCLIAASRSASSAAAAATARFTSFHLEKPASTSLKSFSLPDIAFKDVFLGDSCSIFRKTVLMICLMDNYNLRNLIGGSEKRPIRARSFRPFTACILKFKRF